jgi:phage gp45-like
MKSGNDLISIAKGEIKIKCSKDISIEGKNVSIKSTGKVAVDASSDVNIGGVNVNVKGSMGANVEGGTSANLKSSGMTAVKGSMVNIN